MCRPVVFFVWFAAGWGFPGSSPGRSFRSGELQLAKAAFTSGDVGFISDNTGVRLAGRAIENARRLYARGCSVG